MTIKIVITLIFWKFKSYKSFNNIYKIHL